MNYFDENTLPDRLPPGTRAMLLNVALTGLRALAEAEVCLMHSRCVLFCLVSGNCTSCLLVRVGLGLVVGKIAAFQKCGSETI